MASFSFSAGNAAQLARIPLYAIGRLVTAIVPRSRDAWVFGCAVGIADGALALWQVATREGARAVWLTADERQDAEAAARGIPTVRKGSLRGFWRTARAEVIVVTHGFGDVNRYATGGGLLVQLWHGIPLKRIGLDSPATLRAPLPLLRPLIAALYRATQRRIALLPAASHVVRGRLESAFALSDERVPVTGEPRVDVLSQGTDEERRARARAAVVAAVGDVGDRRLVLYAPTWRDGAPDPAVPTEADWVSIRAALEATDAMLLVRSHPLGAGDYTPGLGERVRLLGSDLVVDVTPLLPAMSLLLTDYSSLIFDASLVPLPVVFLAPDAVAYARERGFYGHYAEVTHDSEAQSWTHAVAQVEHVLSDADERERRVARAVALDRAVHAHRDGGNTERVHRRIRALQGARHRIRGGRRGATA